MCKVKSSFELPSSFLSLSYTFHRPRPSTIHVYWLAIDDDSALFYSSWRQRTRFQWGKKWVTLFHHAYLTIHNSRTFSMLSSLYSHIIYPLNRPQTKCTFYIIVCYYKVCSILKNFLANISTISYN